MIHLISTAEHSRAAWLPQFVEHYRRLGVERFHISVHVEPGTASERAEAAIEEAAQAVDVRAVVISKFDSDSLRAHHDAVQAQETRPGDWIVWADIDEFQRYPGPLPELVRQAEDGGYDYFLGEMIDRVAEDGALVDFDPRRSIWDQYPMRARLTRDVAEAYDWKAACSRAEIAIAGGNHGPMYDHGLWVFPEKVEIHHFKWDSTVQPRLRRRLEPDWKQRCWWWTESARLLEHFERNGGRVDAAMLERAE